MLKTGKKISVAIYHVRIFKCKINAYLLASLLQKYTMIDGEIAHKDVGKRLLVMRVPKLSVMPIGRIVKNVNNA